MLDVAGVGERLNRSRRENQQPTAFHRRARAMAARQKTGIAVNFCGSLRAQKTGSSLANAQLQPGLISGHQAASKIARIREDALAARAGCQQFHRTGGINARNSALLEDQSNFKSRSASFLKIDWDNSGWIQTVKCCRTVSWLSP